MTRRGFRSRGLAVGLLLPVLALVGLGCGKSDAARASSGRAFVSPGEAAACMTRPPGSRTITLAGVDPRLRAAVADRLQSETLTAVAIHAAECDLQIELLACSRPGAFRRERPRADDAEWLDSGQLVHQAFAASGTLTRRAEGKPLFFDARYAERRVLSWLDDIVRARRPLRWGSLRDSFAPALERDDVSGADCSRATHWIRGATYGAYFLRAARPDGTAGPVVDASKCQPPSCAEPIDITVEPIRPLSCPAGSWAQLEGCEPVPAGVAAVRALEPGELVRATCPSAVAGQLTERAAQAKRLFDSERWSSAYAQLIPVVRGETGDDLANRQIAGWLGAIAADRLGDRSRAASLLTAIASQPCHPKHDDAAFYLMALERRSSH